MPARCPCASRSAAVISATDDFPLVPTTWTDVNRCCGIPSTETSRRIAERRDTLRAEVARAEGKLANSRFVGKAPADVVEAERAKLARYQAELEDLS